MKVILCKNMQKAVLKTGVHSNFFFVLESKRESIELLETEIEKLF